MASIPAGAFPRRKPFERVRQALTHEGGARCVTPPAHRVTNSTCPRSGAIALAAACALTVVALNAGSLMSVNPLGASSGVAIQITGTGFNATAKNNRVTFTPMSGGAPQTAIATAIATLDASKGIRRLNVAVPPGLPAGTASLLVTDVVTGETSEGLNFEILQLTLPGVRSGSPGAAGLQVVLAGSPNTQFGALKPARVTFGAGVTVRSVIVETPQRALATIDISATAVLGPRSVTVRPVNQSLLAANAFTVISAPPPNRDPVASANGPYADIEGLPITFSSAGSTDPDGDPLSFSWDFGDGGKSSDPNPQHAYTTAGSYTATLTVSDGRGGSNTATAEVTVAPAVTLLSLAVDPRALRFSELNATAALTVTGRYSDGSERNITGSSTGTTYTPRDPQVATTDANGVVTSLADGTTEITIANSGITQTIAVVVEEGVVLQALELIPPIITLRELGATAPSTLRGSFSDGSLRDLTNDPGTSFSIDDAAIASINATGLLTALAPGAATITGRSFGLSATAQVRVILTEGTGFLRGEVFDDSRGVPLGNATATLLMSGGVALATPQPAIADDRGRFMLPAAAGAALVRLERSGFTAVERRVDLPGNGIVTLLDARLTPLDGRVNLLQSVFGGEATSTDGSAALSVPSGSLESDVALRVTPLSNQGLQGLLPIGWSPIATVDLQPVGRRFTQPATLRLPHADTLAAGASVALAMYDPAQQRWVVQPPGRVSDDRRTLSASIDFTGQLAFVVPDDAPFTPPPAVAGEALMGGTAPVIPDTSTATGEVVPRSAPPGDGARAVGTVILQPPAPVPSGAVLRARVSEQFDLLDSSRVLPLQFVQDIVLYARPRLGAVGSLATRLPITPTLQFSIQQLSLGTVRLDVTVGEPAASNGIVGADGGSLTDAAGNVLELAAGALPADLAVGLLALSAGQLSAPIPDGFTMLGAVLVDLVGAAFAQPGLLSIPRPGGLDPSAQVVVAQVITDAAGGRRLKIIGVGQITTTRVSVQTTVGSLTFEGVRSGGEYVFLQPAQPLGFITGLVNAAGAGAQALALVTADTAPFAVLTEATGTFILAGRVGAPTTVSAIDPAGATASGAVALAALNEVATVNLTMAQTAPAVVATIPAANAVNVALDASIIVDFSKSIDPATITTSSAVLSVGQTAVSVQPVVSANRRRLTITPTSPLAGLTVHTLTLGPDIRDLSGNALAAFTPLTFTTLDPSKAPLALGIITAELPDEDGLSLITGAPGAAEPNSAVVATNLRTQETVTVLSLADGSFRLRVNVVIGDEVALTLRDANGRETTISITQFSAVDGTTSIGEAGGTIQGAGGRIGRILPRALGIAGIFRLAEAGDAQLPAVPTPFETVDRFALTIDGAAFRRLDSLTLTESQGRFPPATTFSAPFASSTQLTVPADFLVSASLRFTAAVADRDGARRSASGTTVVVAGSPDVTRAETGFGDQFPTVFMTAPKQAIPAQVIEVSAVAPTARITFDVPTSVTPQPDTTFVLARLTDVNGETKLAVVDRLERIEEGGVGRLRTVGRDLPGASRAGEYVVVSGPVVFVTGQASGPAATVMADGSPFIFETDGANGAFALPVPADAPFTLRFFDAATGAALGTTNGQAPQAGGGIDLGLPLAPASGTLMVSAQPDQQSVVDIGAPIVFTFSEPIDRASVTPSAFVVTDAAGARAFGQIAVSDDGRTVTFVPLRRWKFGMRYRYGVATSVVAASGARLQQTFSGEFTTFAPRLLGTVALNGARDVAVAGNVGIVATASGAAVLDVTRGDAPISGANIPIAGGARGVALVTSPLIDRNGQPTSLPVAVVAAGDAGSVGVVQTYSLSAPDAPVLLGSTQLTTPSGQSPPAGVPDAPGVPNAVIVTASGRALVAVRDIGLQSVTLGTAIPNDPASAGAALGPRFPTTGVSDSSQSALFGDRIASVGRSGLSILDGTSLSEIDAAASAGQLNSVAVLQAFGFDVNGDGRIEPASEVSDLALAGDDTGVLQLHRIAPAGAPELISAVRMPSLSAIGGVIVNASEGLAYVGIGGRGLAFVDLSGPPSIQPIDIDRDGADDRILAVVDTPGIAGRGALDLARGIAYVADSVGVSTVQIIPPRARFLTLLRDPIRARTGDEEALSETVAAYVTDDAVVIDVEAAVPVGQVLSAAIEEVAADGGQRTLAFDNGTTAVQLIPGLNRLMVPIARGGSGAQAAVVVRDGLGATLARRTFRLIEAPVDPQLTSIFVEPAIVDLSDAIDRAALSVAGVLGDGRVLNVTLAAAQTRYLSLNSTVALVGPDGEVSALGGGRTGVEVLNGALGASVAVRVNRPPTLAALEASPTLLTLITNEPQTLGFSARFSDESERPASEVAGTTFSSSDAGVVVVDAGGRATAIGDGVAMLRAVNGTFEASMQVHVELRGASSVTSIDLAPFTSSVSTDEGRTVASATVTGTGSLHGLVVTYMVSSGAQGRAVTGGDGLASTTLGGFTMPGQFTVTASVQDPATGVLRTDVEPIVVGPGTSDSEPNESDASASTLGEDRTVTGTLTAGSDARDTFRVDSSVGGTLNLKLQLVNGTSVNDVVIIVRDADGRELSRTTPTSVLTELSLAIPSGGAFVAIELAGQAAQYSVSAKVDQGPVIITSVVPTGGPAGTSVVISGSGFSGTSFENAVFFGAVRGKLVTSTPTRLEVVVPVNAVDADLRVVAAARSVSGPRFVVGNAGPLARSFTFPSNLAKRRYDPLSGSVVDVSRLWVTFDPTTTRARVDQLVAGLGATVAGFLPTLNRYLVEAAAQSTLAELRAFELQLLALPDVESVSFVVFPQSLGDRRIDSQHLSGSWSNGSARSEPYELINLFNAIEAVRATEPFLDAFNFRRVKVAVIDTGFNPTVAAEFPAGTVKVIAKTSTFSGLQEVAPQESPSGHGTLVTGLVAASNDGSIFSGVLGSLLRSDERVFTLSTIEVLVYACGIPDGLESNCIEEALEDIRTRGDIDVVNMSFMRRDFGTRRAPPNCPRAGMDYPGAVTRCDFFKQFQPLLGRTLFVAGAGNDGIEAEYVFPASVESDLDNVVSVGAVAVSDEDGTGEKADRRARFGLLIRSPFHPAEVNCFGPASVLVPMPASNCGPGVTLAAPGEDFYVTRAADALNVDYDVFQGTSSAAPVVSAVAAMLQSIRPTPQIIPPPTLKATLVDTADDISSTWQTASNEPMWRVNALAAVREVLPSVTQQRIFVTDHPEGASTGSVVALNVDPLTGAVSGTAAVIPLEYSRDSSTVRGSRPTAIVTPSPGDWAFVLAQTDQPGGDGLFVVNTTAMTIENFIPLNGETFPPSGTLPMIPVRLSLKASMVASRNGRVLYVGAGSRIIVVDSLTQRVVRNLDELTWPRNVARPIPSTYLFLRDADFRQAVQAADGEITSVALSPDDRTLYAAVQTGGGTAFQPGFLLEIDVALDIDKNPTTPALEPDLSGFFQLKRDPAQLSGHDEPSGLAAAPDGQHIYLTNGGVQSFSAILPDFPILGAVFAVFAADMFSAPFIVAAIVDDLVNRIGYTQLLASGRVQAFDVQAGGIASQVWHFPSELSAAWTPSSPVISDQIVRRRINSERTFGMAFRFDGRRALVPFFQTGNFGVLDLVGQEFQPQTAPPGVFQGLVAVTPSLQLDAFLWPPPEQEPLLYPTALTYAQNGRFAVAAHTGVRGGAVTVLDDDRISSDLATHLDDTVPNPDAGGSGTVPFYAVRPLCATRADADSADCQTDVFTTLTEYQASSGSGTFSRPRGVGIQRFVNIVHPGFADRVTDSDVVLFSWRDGRADTYRVSVFDLGRADFGIQTSGPLVAPPIESTLTAAERTKQYVGREFREFFTIAGPPQDNRRYRIEVRIETTSGDPLSIDVVEVVYRQ